jgi:hypothetical protein
MSSPNSEGKKTCGKAAQVSDDKTAGYSASTFLAAGSRNLSEQEKIAIAEKVVRRLGFQSLDEFNKYDEAVQAAKRQRISRGSDRN